MRGDTVKVIYRTPTGTGESIIHANKDGFRVEVIEPRPNELYLTVEEQNRNGLMQSRYLFAKGEVLAVIRGHETAKRPRKAK